MIPLLFFAIFWSDFLVYPLSDVYAYGFLVLAIYLLMQINACDVSKRKTFCFAVLAGIFLYGAYNTRTIYLFAAPVVVLIWAGYRIKNRVPFGKLAVVLASVIAGIMLCGLPQLMLNIKHFDFYSIEVWTEALFERQLGWGITHQKYDTYIGDLRKYPSPAFKFIDYAGQALFQDAGISEFASLSEFIRFVLKYPLDYLGILGRHLINAAYMPYCNAYITDIDPWSKSTAAIFNYTILFLGIMNLCIRIQDTAVREDGLKLRLLFTERSLLNLAPILTCALILPGAIEARFFIPAYFTVYVLAMWGLNKTTILRMKRNGWILVFLYLLGLAICTAVWGNTMASVEYGAQILG